MRSINRRDFLKLAGGGLGAAILARGLKNEFTPPRPNGDPFNLLFIVWDTVRAKSLNLFNGPAGTSPNLAGSLRNGVLFQHGTSTAPWTLPSHASMFTGRYPHELSVNWETGLDGRYPTLAEVLSNNGYATAGFVANLAYCSYEHGLNRGFQHYEGYPVSLGQLALSNSLTRSLLSSDPLRNWLGLHEMPNRKNAAEITNSFLDWMASRGARQPFFAFLNYYDAHEPYLPPPPFDSMFGTPRPKYTPFAHTPTLITRREKYTLSDEEIRFEYDAYLGAIAYMDHHLGRLLDELERADILNHTVVVITSDHGEQFGEHGLFDHGTSLYQPLIHVPLVFLLPANIPGRGKQVSTTITTCDLAATVLDLLSIPDRPIPGNSLRGLWQDGQAAKSYRSPVVAELKKGKKNVPGWYPIANGDMQALYAGGLAYIRNGDGREELYDLLSDPKEEINLAERSEFQGRLENSRAQLELALAV